MKYIHLLLIAATLSAVSCNTNSKSDIYAKVGDHVIFGSQVDQINEQELYAALHKLYILRKATVEELVKDNLYELESSNLHVSKAAYLDSAINRRLNETGIEFYIRDQNLETRGIPSLNNGYRIVDVRSAEGRQLVIGEYKNYLTSKLVDSLKRKYSVSIYLKPPKPPKINFENAPFIRSRGKASAKVTFLEISDFNCENCRNNYALYKELYETYKNEVRFSFSNYSGAVTLSATAALAADKQGKFWEMHDYLFEHSLISNTDTSAYVQIATDLKLDTKKFMLDIQDIDNYKKVKENIDFVRSKNIGVTPTIIVNGRVVVESFSKEAIEHALKAEIGR
jgi:protein-disulfide isomerase